MLTNFTHTDNQVGNRNTHGMVVLSLTSFVPAVRGVQAGPLHPQLGGGGGPHPALPVQLRQGGWWGAGEVLVLRYCCQILIQSRLNTLLT